MKNWRMWMRKNMSHILVPKSQNLWGKLGGQKVIWSLTFNMSFTQHFELKFCQSLKKVYQRCLTKCLYWVVTNHRQLVRHLVFICFVLHFKTILLHGINTPRDKKSTRTPHHALFSIQYSYYYHYTIYILYNTIYISLICL